MLKIIKSIFLFLFFSLNLQLIAQPYTHADTLRGSNGPGRNWWDALKYDLHVKFNLNDSTISGYNIIQFKVLKAGSLMQIDLQDPMKLDSIVIHSGIQNSINLGSKITGVKKEGNAYFFSIKKQPLHSIHQLLIYYHGKPQIAKNPPWDGGIVIKKDLHNNPWVSIACQELGASVWYPCKDIQSDEPDSAEMHLTVPDSLVAVGNGRLRGKLNNEDGTTTYDWAVTVPINNYEIIPYIGKYVHFDEIYKGVKGNLDMDFWVLDYNQLKAKEHFKEVPKMMKAFEYWFGPYPFYKDGYKLVDAPYLGMENQSNIAYGNQYKMGYLGRDRSRSGWGLFFDYIIVHESGHEWFGNNITTKDIADMWVQEGFATYSEVLYVDYYYGKKAGNEYLLGLRDNITNTKTIIGPYNVNKKGSGDMYDKSANLIHTIRQIINNDTLFREILHGLNKTFYLQTVTSRQIENYISKKSNINFSKLFDQYLRAVKIPVLEYKLNGQTISYRFTNCNSNFSMPVKINFNGQRWIRATTKWHTLHFSNFSEEEFSVDPNFYINTKKLN